MKRKELIVLLIIIVVAAAGLASLYFTRQQPNQPLPAITKDTDEHGCDISDGRTWCDIQQKCLSGTESCVATTSTNIVTYFCQEGILIADYASSSVNLTLKGGKNLILPQTISGSGIRYATGTMVFASEGDDALLTDKDQNVYSNCVSGVQTSAQNINTYADTGKTFSFSYPAQFFLSGGEIGYSQGWSYNTPDLGNVFAIVEIPRSFLPGTNFGEAKFTVGTSVDPDAVKNCLTSSFGGTTSPAMINGTTFTKMNFTDAGAGNIYEVTAYHAILNDQCYAMEYVIHSSNIANYSPDQGIKEFDKTKIQPLLENMAQSFKFLAVPASSAAGQ